MSKLWKYLYLLINSLAFQTISTLSINDKCGIHHPDVVNCTRAYVESTSAPNSISEEVDIKWIFQELENDMQNMGNNETFDALYWDLPIMGQMLPENMFGLISFNKIYMRTEIIKIHSNAFQMEACSSSPCKTLFIDLSDVQLTNDTLEEDAFNVTGRTVELNLGNNNLTLIQENIFQQFLLNNRENKIILSENPLICNNETEQFFKWLLDNATDYKERVIGANCSHGISIWDLCWDDYCGTDEKIWLDIWFKTTLNKVKDVQDILHSMKKQLKSNTFFNFMSSLKKMVTIIQKLDNFLLKSPNKSKSSSELSQDFVDVISGTLEQRNAWYSNDSTGHNRLQTGSDYLFLIQKTSFTVNCYLSSESNTKEFVSNNLHTKQYFKLKDKNHFQYDSSSITVPKIADFKGVEQNVDSCTKDSSMGAFLKKINYYMTEGLGRDKQMNSDIIAFSLRNTNETYSLNNGYQVKIVLKHRQFLRLGARSECKFWDKSSFKWSSEGCRLLDEESNRRHTVCECNHLTNFAAIMDLSGEERNETAKHILTLIFCSLSATSLIITILLIIKKELLLKTLRRYKLNIRRHSARHRTQNTEILLKRRDQIVLNESICLLIANLIIMIGMERKESENISLCCAISGILLYFLLASFVWMLLHGIHLFRMTHKVIGGAIKIRTYLAIGYGVPLFIFVSGSIIICVAHHSFKDYYSYLIGNCWISSNEHPHHTWVLLGPVLIIIMVNIGISGYLLYMARKFESKSNCKQALSFLMLFINLGLTWILFVSYINRSGSTPQVFAYIFIVINASQGVFILIYQLAIVANNYSSN